MQGGWDLERAGVSFDDLIFGDLALVQRGCKDDVGWRFTRDRAPHGLAALKRHRMFALQVLVGDAEEGRLHGAGGDLGELKEERGEGENCDYGDEEFFNVLPDAGVRIGPEPFAGGFFQLAHLAFQLAFVGAAVNRGARFGLCRLQSADRFG